MLNFNELAIQQVFNIDAFNLEDGSLEARLTHLKNTSWTNNAQIVYAQGGVGNPKLIGFGHSKESNLSATSATISDGSWGLQAGSGIVESTDSTKVMFSEVLTCTTADELILTHKATGTAGSEIGWIYKVNTYGATTAKYAQADTIAADKFTFTTATNKIALNTGSAAIGDRFLVFYYPTVTTVKTITYRTDVFSKNVKIVANTVFLDTCTGKSYAGQLVFYKAKTGEETTFDLTADGDPAVQSITFEALQSCESPKLWDIFIYDTADISDT